MEMDKYRWLYQEGELGEKTFKLYYTQNSQNKIYDFVKEELNLMLSLAKTFKTNYDDAIILTFIC
jgi:hypothetical protein